MGQRSAWKQGARRAVAGAGLGLGLPLCGCGVDVADPPREPETVTRAPAAPSSPRVEASRPAAPEPEISSDTPRDGQYARFLQEHAGGMIRKAAVGIERRGVLRVEISGAVSPEDAMPLTRSLMAGARKDFPDKTFVLSLYDPGGQPILKARYRPEHGVQYKIVNGPETAASDASNPTATDDTRTRDGATDRDRKFAAWAEEHGKPLLRYVEADLERHGQLLFGISQDVKPADVRPLTQSLLEGARKEFPDRDLVATVYDPNGERIGKARLGRGSDVRWEP